MHEDIQYRIVVEPRKGFILRWRWGIQAKAGGPQAMEIHRKIIDPKYWTTISNGLAFTSNHAERRANRDWAKYEDRQRRSEDERARISQRRKVIDLG